jgi:hypothetical protein
MAVSITKVIYSVNRCRLKNLYLKQSRAETILHPNNVLCPRIPPEKYADLPNEWQ